MEDKIAAGAFGRARTYGSSYMLIGFITLLLTNITAPPPLYIPRPSCFTQAVAAPDANRNTVMLCETTCTAAMFLAADPTGVLSQSSATVLCATVLTTTGWRSRVAGDQAIPRQNAKIMVVRC